MKTIGIKLADGTFYPILEEGTAKKRMLDLTTAKDNQTKVQIDLYRSETGSMDDAEYVDTLEVTKLNPHPNGEPELHLSVGLDEENKLTAEVVDPETGKKSETEVTLVNRSEAERSGPVDYAMAGGAAAAGLAAGAALASGNSNNDGESADDTAAENEDFSFEDYDDNSLASKEASEELPDFSDQIIDDPADIDPSNDETSFAPEELPDIKSDALEDMPFSFDHSEEFDTDSSEAPEADGITGDLPDFSDLDDDFPVDDPTLESVDFSKEKEAPVQTDSSSIKEESDGFNADDYALPDFDSDSTDFSSGSGDSTEESSDIKSEDFSLPDFDAPSDTSDSTSPTGLDFSDLDDPAFDSNDFDSKDKDSTSVSDDDFFEPIKTAPAASAMDFSDLYDKETLAGEHATIYDDDEENKKKTRAPVIICIICAIICVIATILVLFIVPSKYNLIKSRNTQGISILDRFIKDKEEKVVEVPAEEPEKETIVIDVKPEESAPKAEEDKIVIAPEPEKVVPEPEKAPVKEEKIEKAPSQDVKYHIKWGDTLWDISESYYRTPWKYPKIADYNKIRNPDLIISGSDILIPAE